MSEGLRACFCPMTDSAVEKHYGLILTNSDGNAIVDFSAGLLIIDQLEGLPPRKGSRRTTNSARGYIAWDSTSQQRR